MPEASPMSLLHCLRTATILARLRLCAVSPEPLLVAYVISTLFSCVGSFFSFFIFLLTCTRWNKREASHKQDTGNNMLRHHWKISKTTYIGMIQDFDIGLLEITSYRFHNLVRRRGTTDNAEVFF